MHRIHNRLTRTTTRALFFLALAVGCVCEFGYCILLLPLWTSVKMTFTANKHKFPRKIYEPDINQLVIGLYKLHFIGICWKFVADGTLWRGVNMLCGG